MIPGALAAKGVAGAAAIGTHPDALLVMRGPWPLALSCVWMVGLLVAGIVLLGRTGPLHWIRACLWLSGAAAFADAPLAHAGWPVPETGWAVLAAGGCALALAGVAEWRHREPRPVFWRLLLAIALPYLELATGELPDALFLASALAALALCVWCVADSLGR